MSVLSDRFEEALIYATRLHARQVRKGTNIPYISHLLSVAALVLEDGGSEDEAIAALLHDAVEDQGGEATRAEILARFGDRVVAIVDGCTEAIASPRPPWRERKLQYLDKLRGSSLAVQRVSLADKLHNVRSIVADWQRVGDRVWDRFSAKREGTLWFYRSVADTYSESFSSVMVIELRQAISRLEESK
jgi:(p)ppGpp synthase/HD superfamily hydrolase